MTSPSDLHDERRSRLLEAMPAIAWSASIDTFRFTYVNPAAEKLLGYPVQSWLEEPDFWRDHLHPEDRYVINLCHNQSVAGRNHELVYRMIAADGRTVWLRDYINVYSVDGKPVELFGVMVDITREREAEAASIENRENFRRMVELSPDCIGVFVDEIYVYVNQAFMDLLGAESEEQIVGRNVFSFIDPQSWDDARARLEQLRTGRNVPYIREKYRHIDGSPLDVEVAALPMRYGNRDAVQVIARDISDRVRAEEELQVRARKLEEAKRLSSLGQVAASLAHEFNNVLMGIQPFVEIITRSVTATPSISSALEHITRAIARGKRASQEILRFANPKDPQPFVIDARLWLPAFIGQLVTTLPSKVRCSSSIDPHVHFLRGDREHLEQVITNLTFNARDAIAGDGTIHFDVALTGQPGAELVRISVCDDGPGIPPTDGERIFEPLFTTKRNGTGLGLAIARRLMERQGGALTGENRPEGGAAFHLFVPAAPASSISPEPFDAATPGVKRILLIEDDPSVGEGLKTLLSGEGYETTWVRVAKEACEAARRTHPQVAIIDLNLPDGNGADLVPLLRAEHKDLPIVLSTGHVELNLTDEKNRILSLMKPYELHELLTAIESVTAPKIIPSVREGLGRAGGSER
jgi:PAS domain S-box-containing protein